jgi:phosphatidylserine/phosphatidylglycerophosphate/cardiolipin synthase-like enzyme
MLVDVLSSNPLVVSGSANFSDASTTRNDENMLLIQGNQDSPTFISPSSCDFSTISRPATTIERGLQRQEARFRINLSHGG